MVDKGWRGVVARGADLQPGAPHLIDDGEDSEGKADALLATVLHQLKLPVRRHKADNLLGVEAPQVHALVERHVLHITKIKNRRRLQQGHYNNCTGQRLARGRERAAEGKMKEREGGVGRGQERNGGDEQGGWGGEAFSDSAVEKVGQGDSAHIRWMSCGSSFIVTSPRAAQRPHTYCSNSSAHASSL